MAMIPSFLANKKSTLYNVCTQRLYRVLPSLVFAEEKTVGGVEQAQ